MKNQLTQPITDIEFIKKLIPQKPPFVMVDSLFYYNGNKAVSGLFISKGNLLSAEKFFSEAGLVENMAQSVALHGGYGAYVNDDEKPQKGFLGAIKILKIFGLPRLNTLIKTDIEISHDIMGVKLSNITVKNESQEILATATMKTATITL